MMSWANQSQRSGAASAANYKHSMTINDPTASQTITFIIERLPASVVIESLQNLELFGIGQFKGRE